MIFEAVPEFLHWLAVALPSWLLLLGASVGHAYLMTVGLNVLYAWPLPHQVLRFTRKIDIIVILLGPLLFSYSMDIAGSGQLTWSRDSLRFYLAPYTVLCWLAGFVLAPVCQVLYWTRRTAPQVTRSESKVLDIAQELGYKPAGRGKQRSLSLLPGNQCFQVEFVEKTLTLPQLPPAWDGLTILHLTDLHLCGTPDRIFYQRVIEQCQKWETPDLVVVTGDVVDSSWHHRWVVPLLGRLCWKVGGFAILGNHDYWRDEAQIRRRLRKAHFTVLGNSWQQIEVRGQPMIIAGHEGPWFTPLPDLSQCPEGIFRLLLSHTPDNIQWARRHHIDLMLSGHVHGGQICLPYIGSMFVPSRYSRRFDGGTFYLAPTVMHVSRGVAGQHPLRYFCRPEVTRLTLRRGGMGESLAHS